METIPRPPSSSLRSECQRPSIAIAVEAHHRHYLGWSGCFHSGYHRGHIRCAVAHTPRQSAGGTHAVSGGYCARFGLWRCCRRWAVWRPIALTRSGGDDRRRRYCGCVLPRAGRCGGRRVRACCCCCRFWRLSTCHGPAFTALAHGAYAGNWCPSAIWCASTRWIKRFPAAHIIIAPVIGIASIRPGVFGCTGNGCPLRRRCLVCLPCLSGRGAAALCALRRAVVCRRDCRLA